MSEASAPPRPGSGALLVGLALIASLLYGATYQQFRHFDVDDPRGGSDSRSYLAMARGDFDVSATHRFRVVVPVLAGALDRYGLAPALPGTDTLPLAFYLVNYAFALAAAALLGLYLLELGFAPARALLGCALFCTSRVVVYTTGMPLVDSFYLCSVAFVAHAVASERVRGFAFASPILVLSKETIVPVLFLPLAARPFRRPLVLGMLALSLAVGWGLRVLVGGEGGAAGATAHVISKHLARVGESLAYLATPGGLHDLLHPFALVAPLAVAGFVLERRAGRSTVPPPLHGLLVLGAGYALLSGQVGRMLFTAYPVVIPLALVALGSTLATLPARGASG